MKRLIALTVLCFVLFNATASANYATNITPGGLLSGTNQERAQAGVGSLTLNSRLTAAARARANDMVTRDYWSHRSPEGWSASHYIVNAGYLATVAGENLAFGQETSSELISQWMSSSTHKAVMLNGSFTEVGFATANSSNYQGTGPQTVIVGMYAEPKHKPAPRPAAPAPVTPTKPPVQPEPAQPAPADPKPTVVQKIDPAASKDGNRWHWLAYALLLFYTTLAAYYFRQRWLRRKKSKHHRRSK